MYLEGYTSLPLTVTLKIDKPPGFNILKQLKLSLVENLGKNRYLAAQRLSLGSLKFTTIESVNY